MLKSFMSQFAFAENIILAFGMPNSIDRIKKI